jgi:hypothetical protein
MKLHPPSLDLGEVKDVVDQSEQVATRAKHPIERSGLSDNKLLPSGCL